MDADLKPCPFCGCQMKHGNGTARSKYHDKSCPLFFHDPIETTCEGWNRRATQGETDDKAKAD